MITSRRSSGGLEEKGSLLFITNDKQALVQLSFQNR